MRPSSYLPASLQRQLWSCQGISVGLNCSASHNSDGFINSKPIISSCTQDEHSSPHRWHELWPSCLEASPGEPCCGGTVRIALFYMLEKYNNNEDRPTTVIAASVVSVPEAASKSSASASVQFRVPSSGSVLVIHGPLILPLLISRAAGAAAAELLLWRCCSCLYHSLLLLLTTTMFQ
jgi:hypothetical protein